jgi:hypothetical protein
MGRTGATAPSRGRHKQAPVPPPASRLARTAAYYKLFTTTLFILLGIIIVVRVVAAGGSLAPGLIGVCLIGLGVARWVALVRQGRAGK